MASSHVINVADAGHTLVDSLDFFLEDSQSLKHSSQDVETRIQKLRRLSTDSRKPSKNSNSARVPDNEPHSLGAWLQNEQVLEFLNYHHEAKRTGPNAAEKKSGQTENAEGDVKKQNACQASVPSMGDSGTRQTAPTLPKIPTSQAKEPRGGPSAGRRTLISL